MADPEDIKEVEEDNYEFDFSIYESDAEEKQEVVESINKLERPVVTGLRSRFSNGQAELEKLADIGSLITKYSIKVESRVQDIKVLWKYYGLLAESWELIRNIYGEVINTEIEAEKNKCFELLQKYEDKKLEKDVFIKLLDLRSKLYRLKQLSNLGLETEKSARGIYSKAKKSIVQ